MKKIKSYLLVLVFLLSANFVSAASYPELCSVLNRTMLRGDIGADVRQLQLALAQEGIAFLGGTGFYGPLTETAVKTFQLRNNIYPVGKVGPQTLGVMRRLWCSGSPVGNNNNNNNGVLDAEIFPVTDTTNNVNITWTTKNARTCSINNDTNLPVSGSRSYQVFNETTFNLTCNGFNGNSIQKTIIIRPNVNSSDLPKVNVSMNPVSALINTTATIYWTSTNASYCTFNGQNVGVSGSQQIYISNTSTNYTVACTGNGRTSSTTIYGNTNVNNNNNNNSNLSITATTNKNNYNVGENFVLDITLRNNTNTSISYLEPICSLYGPFNITIDGQDMYSFLENGARPICLAFGNSTINLAPYQTKTYSFTSTIASKTFSNALKALRINMNNVNSQTLTTDTYFSINSITNSNASLNVSPTSITTGQPVTLTWSSANASYCTFVANNLTFNPNGNVTSSANGSITIYPTQTTTYTVNCFGSQQTSAQTTVQVNSTTSNNLPTLTINPSTQNINAGATATLNYSSNNANSCSINGGIYSNTQIALSGSINVSPNVNTTYTVTCNNSFGITNATFIVNMNSTSALPSLIVATPTIGTYSSPQNISLSSLNSSSIRYTTNGTTPTCDAGSLYSLPINVANTQTIRAIACNATGDTGVQSFTFTITAPIAPVASPVPGTYSREQSIILTSSPMSSIRYTTNGTIPSCTKGTLYNSMIPVVATQTIRAVACNDVGSSTISVFTYNINLILPATVVSTPAPGTYTSGRTVSLNSARSTSIRYTVDGTTPTCTAGDLYTSAISVPSTRTIRAIGCNSAGSTDVSNFVFNIQ